MKNNVIKLISAFSIAALFASCSPDTAVYNVDGGQSLIGFNEKVQEFSVYSAEELPQGYDNTITLTVGSSVRSKQDRTYVIQVNEEFTTADPSMYTVETTSFVIPAGEFSATIKIKGNFDALPGDYSSRVLSYDLISVDGSTLFNEDMKTTAIEIKRGCVKTVAASYTGTSNAGGAPYDVTLVPVTGVANTWSTTNLWGDYVAAATGNDTYLGQYPYPARLTINCTNTVTVQGTASYGGASPAGGTYRSSDKYIKAVFNNTLFSGSAATATVELNPN